jgi:hypothetical protein
MTLRPKPQSAATDQVSSQKSSHSATEATIRSNHCWNQSLRQYQKAENRPFRDLFRSAVDWLYRTSLNPISASRFTTFQGILCDPRAGLPVNDQQKDDFRGRSDQWRGIKEIPY